ncbi:hypothetical protein ACP275_12G008500 [Erythranthe tilingii]
MKPDNLQKKKKMKSDNRRREIEYALEYAMLAIQNQLPPTPQADTDNPIRIPENWKPSMKLPHHMLETRSNEQLDRHISKLFYPIHRKLAAIARDSKNKNKNKNNKRRLNTASKYLTTCQSYIRKAIEKELQGRPRPRRTEEELRAIMREMIVTPKETMDQILERSRAKVRRDATLLNETHDQILERSRAKVRREATLLNETHDQTLARLSAKMRQIMDLLRSH